MGTTLRTVVEDIGGGVPGGKKFKAAQTGGPSGGCIPASLIDTPIDYDSLIAIGSMMGSGGLIVMDEDNCMVDIAKFFLEFTVDESCGKCTPCRIGTKRLLELLTKITEGNGTLEDLDTIEELCYYIKQNALCGLGQTAPNPVLSTLKHFRDEYVAHVVEKRCPAGVCKALLHYTIDPDKCKGCTLCARNCPAGAITGAVQAPPHHRTSQVHQVRRLHGQLPLRRHLQAVRREREHGNGQSENQRHARHRARGLHDPGGRPDRGHQHPHPVLSEGHQRDRRLPHLRGGGQGGPQPGGRLRLPGERGHGGLHQHRQGPQSRQLTLELILSNHRMDCLTCARSGHCELQQLCQRLGIDDDALRRRHMPRRSRTPPPTWCGTTPSASSAAAAPPCAENQEVGVIGANDRGFDTHIGCAFDGTWRGGLRVLRPVHRGLPHRRPQREGRHRKVWAALNDPTKHVVVQTAPSVRVTLGECFGMPIGTNVEGKMVAALRRLGFDKVFDTDFAADLTIMEEATEFLHRLQDGGALPLITSCSPGWIQYCEQLLPRHAAQPVHLQVPPADVRRPGQDLLRREGGHRPPGHRRGVRDALHRQEVRGRAGRSSAADGCPTWTSPSPPGSWPA